MKNLQTIIIKIISNICIILFVNSFLYTKFGIATNFGSSGTNVEGNGKQTVNYYGKLITQQGQENTVENISINGKIKDIIMYDSPAKHAQAEVNTKTKQLEIKIDTNPTTDFVKSKIDLSKVSELYVPNPNTIWLYQQDEKHQRQEFTQILITAQESTHPKAYLLEHKTQVLCNSIDNGNSQKKEVPLAAIEKLIIEGYSFSPNKTNQKKESAECLVEKNNKEKKGKKPRQ